jgi:hypothetical protein
MGRTKHRIRHGNEGILKYPVFFTAANATVPLASTKRGNIRLSVAVADFAVPGNLFGQCGAPNVGRTVSRYVLLRSLNIDPPSQPRHDMGDYSGSLGCNPTSLNSTEISVCSENGPPLSRVFV